jgi:hypothetical protein
VLLRAIHITIARAARNKLARHGKLQGQDAWQLEAINLSGTQ